MTTDPQIYLITPEIDDAAAFGPALRDAIARTGAASVLLRLIESDERAAINRVKLLAPIVQAAGAAALVEDNPTVAVRGGADGVHMTGPAEALRQAAKQLQPERIVGCGDLRSRHDAMEAGETGVDYVMFGEPWRDKRGQETAPPVEDVIEQASWWAHLFEVPCVAYAASAQAAAALKATGAEFVALGPWAFDRPA